MIARPQFGDLVEVDRPGLPHHGEQGVVHRVDDAEAVVQLVRLNKEGSYTAFRSPMVFSTWELNVLHARSELRSGE